MIDPTTTGERTPPYQCSVQTRWPFSSRGGLVGPQLRASNEAVPRARAFREQEDDQAAGPSQS